MITLWVLLQHIEFGRTVVLVEHMTEKEIVTFTLTQEVGFTNQYENMEDDLELKVMNISTTPTGALYIEIL
ncbi:hypothetical protein [Enterococcus phage vB_Efs22_KEN09]|nr:hypothetical protein OLACOIGA_00022 [Enterococcus phage vB_Efa29212_2e]